MGVQVHGVEEAIRAFRALSARLAPGIDAGHRSLAEKAASEMRANAPRDTGRLASTIRVERTNPFRTTVVVGNESTPYLGHVEFGTRTRTARPFVRQAAANAEGRFAGTMTGETSRRLG